MYCDIYSLGQGEVSHTDERTVFSLRNLQVLYGYVFDRIPTVLLKRACGSLGEWKATDGTMPLLEIVYHRQTPLAYMQLPPECRTKDFQKAGTSRRLVPITNPVERAMFATGQAPYKVDPLPFGPAVKPAKKWDVPNLQEEAKKRVEELKRGASAVKPDASPEPQAPPFPPQKAGSKDPHARPDIKDFLPSQDEVHINPAGLDFGGPRPGDISPGGLLDEEDVTEPSETSYALQPPPSHCTAKTARGDPCRRAVKTGTVFCGGHQPKP